MNIRLITLFLLLPFFAFSQDVVTLKSGKQFNGSLVSISKEKASLLINGNEVFFDSKDIASIQYGDGRKNNTANFNKTDSIVGKMVPVFTAISRFSHEIEVSPTVTSYNEGLLEITDLYRYSSNISYGIGASIGKALDPYINENAKYSADEKQDNGIAFSVQPTIRLNSHYLFGFSSLFFNVETGLGLMSDYFGSDKDLINDVNRKLRLGAFAGGSFGIDFKFNNFHLKPFYGGRLLRYRDQINDNNNISSQVEIRDYYGIKVSFDYNRKRNKEIIKSLLD